MSHDGRVAGSRAILQVQPPRVGFDLATAYVRGGVTTSDRIASVRRRVILHRVREIMRHHAASTHEIVAILREIGPAQPRFQHLRDRRRNS